MSEAHGLRVAQVMTRTASCLSPTASLAEAYEWFLAEGVHGAPVVDDAGQLCGVVSGSDLLAALAPVLDPQGEPDMETLVALRDIAVRRVMEGRPVTCRSDATLAEACALMAKHAVSRLIVVDDQEVAGVLAASDVVRAVADPAGFGE